MHAGSFGSVAPSHAWSGGQFAHNGNFAPRYGNFAGRYGQNWGGRYGNWAGHHDWDRYFTRGGWGGGGWGWGWGGWPWYGGWGWGSYWGYPYDYGYSYPYTSDYYYSYAPSIYSGGYYSYAPSDDGADYSYSYARPVYGDSSATMSPLAAAPQQVPDESAAAPTDQQGAAEGFSSIPRRAAFLHGDYRNALRLATHAGVDEPRNPKVHELISLAFFALRNYGPAASEAHAAMALGPIADWKELFSYYNDAEKYTAQLAALEVEKYTTQLLRFGKGRSRQPQVRGGAFPLGVSLLDDRCA